MTIKSSVENGPNTQTGNDRERGQSFHSGQFKFPQLLQIFIELVRRIKYLVLKVHAKKLQTLKLNLCKTMTIKKILNRGLCFALLPFLLFAEDSELLPFDNVSSVIYDNDDHRDVYTDEFLMALSHLGEIDLKALITTYSANDTEYRLFVTGRKEIVKEALQSGLRNLPVAMAGTNKCLVQPETNRIKDTEPLNLPASQFIVEHARSASHEKPLVIVTGGQLTVVADAYLIDPSIADNIIVSGIFGASEIDYNAGLDSWAWKIVLSAYRVLAIPIGPPKNRGKVYMKPPHVPKTRIKQELPQEIDFFKWMYEKEHPTNELPAEHDFDGQAAIPLTCPAYITKVRRWSVLGLDNDGNLLMRKDSKGRLYEAVDANQELATKEFWRVMDTTAYSLN